MNPKSQTSAAIETLLVSRTSGACMTSGSEGLFRAGHCTASLLRWKSVTVACV